MKAFNIIIIIILIVTFLFLQNYFLSENNWFIKIEVASILQQVPDIQEKIEQSALPEMLSVNYEDQYNYLTTIDIHSNSIIINFHIIDPIKFFLWEIPVDKSGDIILSLQNNQWICQSSLSDVYQPTAWMEENLCNIAN